jgi:acyl carrier protein
MTETEIRALAAEVLAGIAPEADLATVGLDSMDFMNFVIGLSQATGRKIPDADTPRLQTLRALVAYLGD